MNQLMAQILELAQSLTNVAQADILRRVVGMRHEDDQVYLSSYEPNTETTGPRAQLEGTFHMLGSMRKGTRESYTVQWYKPGGYVRGSFWCNCPGHKFNATKKNIVCKHISFLLCRVVRCFDVQLFNGSAERPGHFQTPDQFDTMKSIVGNAAIFQDRSVVRNAELDASRDAAFTQVDRAFSEDDACPICYDGLHAQTLLCCPTCSNAVHKDCMHVWLERQTTCVYCRSNVWRLYGH